MKSELVIAPTARKLRQHPVISLLPELAILVALGLLPRLFFWRLFTDRLQDQAHIAWGDFAAQYFPLRLFAAHELAQGRLPLWNPFLNGGQPSLADSQSAVFYLPNLLWSLATSGDLTISSLEHYAALHFAFAGVFTYLFARYILRGFDRPIARLAAVAAALTFAYGGYLTSFPVQQLTILEASVWLPLFLLLLDLSVDRRSFAIAALASLPLALSWSAGHAQTTMYLVIVAAAYVLLKIGFAWRGWADLRLIACAFLSFALGTALAAAQLLPTVEFLQLSTRGDLAYRDTSFGLPWQELTGLVLPGVFAGRSLYVGVLGLTFAALAIVYGQQSRVRRVWLGFAIVGLLVALGGHTFLYSVLYLLVPGFAAIRDQERAVFVVSLSLSILAGYGLANFLSAGDDVASSLRAVRRILLWAALAFFSLAILALVARAVATNAPSEILTPLVDGSLVVAVLSSLASALLLLRERRAVTPSALAAIALFLVFFDLSTANWQANLVDAKDTSPYQPTKLTQTIASLPDYAGWRISTEGLLPGGGSAASVYGLRDIVGNTPFQLDKYATMSASVDEMQRSRLLSVGYWITKRNLTDGRLKPLGTFGDAHLYSLDPAFRLARAYLVHDVLVVPDGEVLTTVASADLSRVAVLGQSQANRLAIYPQPILAGNEPQPRFIDDGPTRQLLEVNLTSPGLLVLSEIDYPGWLASVDGRAVPVLAAQYLLRAVALPAGQHQVEFRFQPASLQRGIAVSTSAAILFVVVLLAALVWRSVQGLRRRGAS